MKTASTIEQGEYPRSHSFSAHREYRNAKWRSATISLTSATSCQFAVSKSKLQNFVRWKVARVEAISLGEFLAGRSENFSFYFKIRRREKTCKYSEILRRLTHERNFKPSRYITPCQTTLRYGMCNSRHITHHEPRTIQLGPRANLWVQVTSSIPPSLSLSPFCFSLFLRSSSSTVTA